MSSPKGLNALKQLGQDLRVARLRRRMPVADLSVRAGTSATTIARLERGDPGVAIGTLADVLVVLGLSSRFTDLLDIRHDDLGLALASEQLPQRGRSLTARAKRGATSEQQVEAPATDVDPDGIAF